jgi:hypothetical protein
MMSIQNGTLLLATATFIGALVGSFIQYYLNYRNRKREIRHLRVALKSEIEQILNGLETSGQVSDQAGVIGSEEPMFALSPDSLFPTAVFEGNTNKIGTLSEEEVTDIIALYSAIMNLKGFLSMFREEEVIKRREEIPIGSLIRTIENRSDELQSEAQRVVDILEKNL